ncbi:MAG: hypothetical protein RR382_01880 [Tannerellaceae bacterium]
MDWINLIITSIVALGGTFLFYRENKRGKIIENEARQSEEWKKLYEESKQDSKEKDAKIDSLYLEIKEHRADYYELQKDCETVKLDNVKMKMLKCEKPGCTLRTPPTGY